MSTSNPAGPTALRAIGERRQAKSTSVPPQVTASTPGLSGSREMAPIEPAGEHDSCTPSRRFADIIDRSLHAAAARFTAGLVAGGSGRGLSRLGNSSCLFARQAHAACRQSDRKAVRFANYIGRCAREGGQAKAASSRCRRTAICRRRIGSNGPTTSSIRHSCFSSNGGTTPRPAFAASPSSMRTWSSSPRARCLDMLSPSNFLLTNPEVLRTPSARAG